jgi:hypothetical protein
MRGVGVRGAGMGGLVRRDIARYRRTQEKNRTTCFPDFMRTRPQRRAQQPQLATSSTAGA